MTQTEPLIPHLVAKIRMLDKLPPALDRARAWVTLRPLPPGMEPVFLGSIWFWHDGRGDPRAPALHLVGAPADSGPVPFRYVNLFFDANLGGISLLDTGPGWRRLDFLFALADAQEPLSIRAVVQRPRHDETLVIEAGSLDLSHGVWRFQPTAALPADLASPEPPPLLPCFIGGAPKSGTTWVQMLLNQHPAVFATGEGAFLRRASMRPYRINDWWVPPRTPQLALDLFASHAALWGMFRVYHEFTQCGWIVDKSPGNARVYGQILAYAPTARLVHCVRHPLDVLVSRLHHEASFLAGGEVSREMAAHAAAVRKLPTLLAGAPPLRFDAGMWAAVAGILDDYADSQVEALEIPPSGEGPLLVVRYEDMLRDAAATAARIFAHLGVPTTPEQAARCVRDVSFANLRDKRGGRAHSFFRAGAAGQYARLLTPEDQARAMAHLRARLPRIVEIGYHG